MVICQLVFITVITGDDIPSMADLYSNVIHQYAAQWEKLGLKLGLPHYDIANISADHALLRVGRLVACCRTILEKWLQKIPSPTWGKLDDVIKFHKGKCTKILETLIDILSLLQTVII